ncbi:hypothetical protein EHO61_09100 [Leptospira fluminis]|uniref:Uncharacterized protein n=1 Tax=Leptospira fluminis TaxID=2484979 RepID=A0A4V3JEH7_9LEPT|nr:hypothetical protein [Leptospira fluminis]TGK18624.1 hypothetical protein EHO61_09100 [Leptospira fluminis]
MFPSVFQILLKRKILLSVLFVLFLIYHSVFNSFTGQILFDRVFVPIVRGELRGKIRKFSPLYGIRIEDLALTAGPEWGTTPVLQAKGLEFSYNLPYILFGRLKISRISLEDTTVRLKKKKGIWNVATLFAGSDSGGKAEPPSPQTKEPISVIRTYLPVSAFLKLELKNMQLGISSEQEGKPFEAEVEGLDLDLEIDTERFSSIPLNLSALGLIDDFKLSLNPQKPVRIRFRDPLRQMDHPFRLTWVWERSDAKHPFRSKMDIGADKIRLKIADRMAEPFGFSFRYDLDYSPVSKEIVLKNLKLVVNEDEWLEGGGRISGIGSELQNVHFALQKSSIRLAPISGFLTDLGIRGISLRGDASLAPLLVEGTSKELRATGEVKASDLDLRIGAKAHYVRELHLDWDGRFRPQPTEDPTAEKPLPWIALLNVKRLKAYYNGSSLAGTFFYSGDSSLAAPAVDLKLALDRFSLAPYVSGMSGLLSVDLTVKGRDFSDLNAGLSLKLSDFRFPYGRGNSGNIGLSAKGNYKLLFLKKPWALERIKATPVSVSVFSPDGERALFLESFVEIGIRDSLALSLGGLKIEADLDELIPPLPLALRESLIPLRSQIGSRLSLGGNLNYVKREKKQEIGGNVSLNLPALEIKDGKLNLSAKVEGTPPDRIFLDRMDLTAFSGKLSLSSQGVLTRAKPGEAASLGDFSPELRGSLRLVSAEDAYLIKGLTFRGDLRLGFGWQGSDVRGTLTSKDSSLYVSNRLCPSAECKLYRIDGLNAAVPFQHDLSVKETRNLIEGDKRKFVLNYGRMPEPNFTIREIVGTHPSLKGVPFEYIKPKTDSPGLSANLSYSENYLRMDFLRIHTLDGEVLGKDVIVNVGSGDPERMEYSMELRVKDIDLKQLLPGRSRGKIDDGKIKADLNLWGRNLGDPIPNLNLFFSVYQIGRDFGKSAINIFAPSNLLTDFIYTSYAVDKIELELSKGLVYAVILFKRSVLGTLVNLENNQVSQQRMPLANFLNRAQSEIETYNK